MAIYLEYLYKNLINIIIDNLPAINIILLKNAKIFNIHFDEKEYIKSRLIEYGFSKNLSEKFNTSLIQSKSILSGSFMVSCMISPINDKLNWKPNDLDIYCEKFDSYCHTCDMDIPDRSEFSDFLCENKFEAEIGYNYPIIKILKTRKWYFAERDEHIIVNEIIIEKDINIKTFIYETFDFDFCKIVYDGNIISFYDINSIINKKCIYKGDKESFKYYDELEYVPYEGNVEYTIHSERMIDFRLSKLLKTYTSRKEKYTRYGFEIICDFDFADKYLEYIYTKDKISKFVLAINKILPFVDCIYTNYSRNYYQYYNLLIKPEGLIFFKYTNVEFIKSEHYKNSYVIYENMYDMFEIGRQINEVFDNHFKYSKYTINCGTLNLTISFIDNLFI